MPGSFTEKKIDVQFELANGQFEGGGNTMTVTGLRVLSHIVNVGAGAGTAEFSIYGLPLSVMNQLSTVGNQILKMNKNGISARAGDDETGMSVVWTGAIVTAFVDAYNMPEVCLRVTSVPGVFHAMKPVPPTTISGSTDAAGLVSKLAKQMGFQFENAGVTAKLVNPYYPGTAWTQMHQIAHDAGFDIVVDRGTVAIVPTGKSRAGDTPLISPDTGLVGYPSFQQAMVLATVLFNPTIKPFGDVKIKSDLTSANGTWKVISIEYDLDSITPQGNWFMHLNCVSKQGAPPAS